MARDGKAGKMGSTPSGYGGLGSQEASPIRTPEGVARPLSHTCTDGATGSDHLDQQRLGDGIAPIAERAPAEQDFRFEGELHELFAVAERALLAHELEQLDVDRPAVTIAGQRYHRVLRRRRPTPVQWVRLPAAHLVPRRLRAGSGSAGVAGGHHRGPLDAAGGAPSELSGGSSDAPGGGRYAARVRQHESLEEQPGPAPEAAEQPLGGAPRRVRGGVAGGAIRALCSDHGGGIAGWSDGADEGRGAAGEACRNAG